MKRKSIQNQRGITLLEVLVAMIILGFSLILLLNMAMVALDGNNWSNNTTITTQLLQEKLEQLRTLRNTALASGHDTAQGFTRTWTVTNLGSHLRQVDVQIKWEDFRQNTHNNSIMAILRTDSI